MTGSKPRIAILDYGAANMVSISRALSAVGADIVVADEPSALADSDAIVVPGVGAAKPAMNHLRERDLLHPLKAWVSAGRPCLGICLGLQLFFEASDEGDADALGIMAGRTVGLVDAPTLPHIGWNSVEIVRQHPLLEASRTARTSTSCIPSHLLRPTKGWSWLARRTASRSSARWQRTRSTDCNSIPRSRRERVFGCYRTSWGS